MLVLQVVVPLKNRSILLYIWYLLNSFPMYQKYDNEMIKNIYLFCTRNWNKQYAISS